LHKYSNDEELSLLSGIGNAVWEVFIPQADLAVFQICLFDSAVGVGALSFYKKQELIRDSTDEPLYPDGYINTTLRPLALTLQRTPPFSNTPFTHMRFEMDEQGKTQVDFAYIPEWDSWPGLFMRGVSEVPEEEASKRPRFYKAWHECRARREREPYTK
jgi:hypothetical protein